MRVSERAPRCRSSGISHPATVLGSLKARDDWPTRTRMASNRRRRLPMSQSRIQRAQNRVNRMHRVPTQTHLRSRPLRNVMLRRTKPCESRVIPSATPLCRATKCGPLAKPTVSKVPPRSRIWRGLRPAPTTIRPVTRHRPRQRAIRLRAKRRRRSRKQLVSARMYMAKGSVRNPLDADAQIPGTAAGIASPTAPRVDGATEPQKKMRRPGASGRAGRTRRGFGGRNRTPIPFRAGVATGRPETMRRAGTSGIVLLISHGSGGRARMAMEHQTHVGIGEKSTLAATIAAGPARITPSMME